MDQSARVEGREIGREGKVIPRLGNNNIIDQRILKIDMSSMHIVAFSGKEVGNHEIIKVIKVPSNVQLTDRGKEPRWQLTPRCPTNECMGPGNLANSQCCNHSSSSYIPMQKHLLSTAPRRQNRPGHDGLLSAGFAISPPRRVRPALRCRRAA